MNYCQLCNGPLKLLQESLRNSGFAAPSQQTGEIRGCRKCDITYYFGANHANEEEHWMRTPFKFNEFGRANEDWNELWKVIDPPNN